MIAQFKVERKLDNFTNKYRYRVNGSSWMPETEYLQLRNYIFHETWMDKRKNYGC